MKQEISRPLLIAIISVAVLVLAFVGWNIFGPQSGASAHDIAAFKAKKARLQGEKTAP